MKREDQFAKISFFGLNSFFGFRRPRSMMLPMILAATDAGSVMVAVAIIILIEEQVIHGMPRAERAARRGA